MISDRSLFIIIALFCYVIAQVAVKLDNKRTPLRTNCFIGLSFGIVSVALLIREWCLDSKGLCLEGIDWIALAAGVFIFIGNLFWIYTIRTGMPLGHIRIVLSGLESLSLLIIGYLFLKESCLKPKHLIGISLTMLGVYLLVSK